MGKYQLTEVSVEPSTVEIEARSPERRSANEAIACFFIITPFQLEWSLWQPIASAQPMVHVKETIDIKAEPAQVFALVTDVARKAEIDPNTRVLGVSQETESPVGLGTVFHYRLVIEGKIADYHSTCTAFESGRMIETVSDSQPPFKIRVTVEPTTDGCRLTQEESFSLPVIRVPVPQARGWLGNCFRLLFGDKEFLMQGPEVVTREEARIQQRLQTRLARWLAAIKASIEAEQSIEA